RALVILFYVFKLQHISFLFLAFRAFGLFPRPDKKKRAKRSFPRLQKRRAATAANRLFSLFPVYLTIL
ncbi:MAG TPA: hypothetical protein DCE65_05155, partial [Clostridiales bacterium]|nr:hypothetical protein [Clostridiales bacterium]